MAPVNGRPFLYYLFRYLETQSCSRVILSLGYRHEVVKEWIAEQDFSFEINWVVETEPLGTGGGILLAMEKLNTETACILNGDTFFQTDLRQLLRFHQQKQAETTLALKQMRDFQRYGSVRTDAEGTVLSFEEKKFQQQGLVNGGVYTVDRQAVLGRGLPRKCSFEKDYLERFVGEGRFFGLPQEGYFIDIGVPEDYEKAQVDFKELFG